MSENNLPTKPKMGRPPSQLKNLLKLNKNQITKLFELAISGQTLSAILKSLSIDRWAFETYRANHKDFDYEFRHCLSLGIDAMVDELIVIPDEYTNPIVAKLKSDNIKWLASKRKPTVYGDRLDLNVTSSVDIKAALSEARDRVKDAKLQSITDPDYIRKSIRAGVEEREGAEELTDLDSVATDLKVTLPDIFD